MKQLLSALIIMLVSGSMGLLATMAHFSDTETSTANYIETGSLDLQLRRNSGPWSDGLSQVWNLPLSAPGDSVWSSLQLRNVGSTGSWVDIDCRNTNSESTVDEDVESLAENLLLITNGIGVDNDNDGRIDEDPIDGIDNDGDGLVDEDPPGGVVPLTAGRGVYDKDRWLEITEMTYKYYGGTIDLLKALSDADKDGRVSLNDLEKLGIRGLPAPLPGGTDTATLTMTVQFAAGAGNEYQGDRTNMKLTPGLR